MAVDVRGVDFSYGARQVLFDVDLHVMEGELLALLGTNGAGKSTLLRVLAGLGQASSGTLAVGGVDATAAGALRMVELGVALVQGGRALFGDMTLAENLEVGAYTLRKSRAKFRQRQDEVLSLFPDLAGRRSQVVSTLSGGQQQQLALAKAFLLEPRVLCIDELSLGLAPITVASLLELVRERNKAGTTVILVEQSLHVAASLCRRAVFLEKGQVRFEGLTRDLLDRSDIARAVFLGAKPGASA